MTTRGLPGFLRRSRRSDFEETDESWRAVPGEIVNFPDEWEQDYRVMVESLRDYFRKTGFKKALLGLSGGIDSAIVATIASDALGPENVRCVMLPSKYTSQESLDDAGEEAEDEAGNLATDDNNGSIYNSNIAS